MLEVLGSIPFNLDVQQVIGRLGVRQVNKEIESMITELTNTALSMAKPKAVYKVSFVNKKNVDSVEIDGIKFKSKLLRTQLDKVNRVFPYLATCGTELDNLNVQSGDMLKAYCLDTIKTMGLALAVNYLSDYVRKRYNLSQTSHMNPGSLNDWPLEQQKVLFSLFPNATELIGIRLSNSFVMHPIKSVSGICYPNEIRFESCQLCPREKCSGRRAPYSPEMVAEYQLQNLG